jgi:hypothetical protein
MYCGDPERKLGGGNPRRSFLPLILPTLRSAQHSSIIGAQSAVDLKHLHNSKLLVCSSVNFGVLLYVSVISVCATQINCDFIFTFTVVRTTIIPKFSFHFQIFIAVSIW